MVMDKYVESQQTEKVIELVPEGAQVAWVMNHCFPRKEDGDTRVSLDGTGRRAVPVHGVGR